MINVLITGSDGFIAKEIINIMERRHSDWNLYKTNRDSLDISDMIAVEEFFDKNKIDIVLHCAVSGGRRNQPDTPHILYDNKLMFESLVRNRDKFKLMITFGSGAETNRKKDIMNYSEIDFIDSEIPSDNYGLSKHSIARRVRELDNVLNLRIFNVFGEFEANDRMVKNNINNYLSGKPLEIYKDRVMDFFGANDLYKVINYIINTGIDNLIYKDLNMCYKDKHTLLDVANIINNLSDKKSEIRVVEKGMAPSYCGDSSRLDAFGLTFKGLERSIKDVYNSMV